MNAKLPGSRLLKAIACFFLSLGLLTAAGVAASSTPFTGTSVDLVAKGPSTKTLKDSMQSKVSSSLIQLNQEYRAWLDKGGPAKAGPFHPSNNRLPLRAGNFVVVDATAQVDAKTLMADLERLGCTKLASFKHMVSATCPIASIAAMSELDSLNFARAASAITNVGVVDSQGDAAMRADVARSLFGVDGGGITIGSMSDSYNCLGGAATDVANGDLPGGIVVLDDVTGAGCGTTDEGRGMMQLIADVAPDADQAFHTAFPAQVDFANGIVELQSIAGADIIVDDVIYFAEPMFQDGIIAQAVDDVTAAGVVYFSSSGNARRDSYESDFRPSGQFETLYGGQLHDFDPGGGVDVYQTLTSTDGTYILQWDEPYFAVSGAPGAGSDYDFWFCNDDTQPVSSANCPNRGDIGNIGNDPIERVDVNVPGSTGTVYVAISRFAGSDNNFLKYVAFVGRNFNMDQYNTAGSTNYGHSNADGAIAVGASFYANTPLFVTAKPILNDFSSAGGTRILFDEDGNPTSIQRQRPQITGPDGGNTSFFGSDIADPGDGSDLDTFPNFFGTSASAPHAAAVAALMLDAAGGPGSLTPAGIIQTMQGNSIDILRRSPDIFPSVDPGFDNLPVGFDFDSGSGMILADSAVQDVLPHACCNYGGPGCADPSIRSTVCAADPFCCDVFWDGLCVGEVTSVALEECDCCEPHATAEGCAQDVSSVMANGDSPWAKVFAEARAQYERDPSAFARATSPDKRIVRGHLANLAEDREIDSVVRDAGVTAVVAKANAVEEFPSLLSTVVGSGGFLDADEIGYFWSAERGDSVSQNFSASVPAAILNRAIFDLSVPTNTLDAGAFVDWEVLIEFTVVGSFQIVEGQTGTVHVDVSFPPIVTGAQVSVELRVVNEVPGGAGSHTLGVPGTVQFIGVFDDDIASCVCARDSYCCQVTWDTLCVDEVEEFGCGICEDCGLSPAPAGPDPFDGATGVPLDKKLSWNNAGGSSLLFNGGFESGSFTGWVVETGPGGELQPWTVTSDPFDGYFGNGVPLNGAFFAENGFDGDAGLFYALHQEVAIPSGAVSAVLTWYERIQWDLTFGAVLPRIYEVTLEPAGGGAPLALLFTRDLAPGTVGDTGYVLHTIDLLDVAPGIAGSTVRLRWFQAIPESFTGPAQMDIDAMNLAVSFTPLSADQAVVESAPGILGSRSTPEREAFWRARFHDKIELYHAIRAGDVKPSAIRASDQPVVRSEVPAGYVIESGALVAKTRARELTPAPAKPATNTAERLLTGALVDFDDAAAPCVFIDTVRLTNQYAAQGVTFVGPGGNDGGAILDECSGFAVTGQSSTNFLAFNTGLTMLDGGVPQPPQTLLFDPAVSQVQVVVGSGTSSGEITMEAYDSTDALVAADAVFVPGTSGDALVPLYVSGTAITRVVIRSSAPRWVLDNLRFETCAVTYDVLGGLSSPPLGVVCADIPSTVCDPGPLPPMAEIYWQVIARTAAGDTPGPIWSFETITDDADSDGIVDASDNCIFVPNGPAIPDAGGFSQRDTNGDGIGNVCDADSNNDCSVSFGDLADLKAAFTPRPYNPDVDLNGDGFVNFGDLAIMKSTFFNGPNPGPGPSGLPNACTP